MLIGAFTTDWQESPLIDEEKSQATGKQEVVEGQKTMSFGGTFYYRGAMPLMELAKHGHDVKISWKFNVAPDGHIRMMDTDGEWFDPEVVWTQRWMHKDGAEQMRRARAAGQIVVADLDDGFWNLPKSNIAADTTSPKNNPEFNRDHYLKVLAAGDAITVSTDALAKDMERLCPGVPVFICKNAIDLELWKTHDPRQDGFIGWVGGIQWRAKDLHVLRPSLPKFLIDNDLPIYHGGDSEVPGVPKLGASVALTQQKQNALLPPSVTFLNTQVFGIRLTWHSCRWKITPSIFAKATSRGLKHRRAESHSSIHPRCRSMSNLERESLPTTPSRNPGEPHWTQCLTQKRDSKRETGIEPLPSSGISKTDGRNGTTCFVRL